MRAKRQSEEAPWKTGDRRKVSGCEEMSLVFRAFYLAENVWQRLRDIYLGREKGWVRSLYSSKLCLKAPGKRVSTQFTFSQPQGV